MTDLSDNPMGLDGFEFIEFASPEPEELEPIFEMLGFEHVANHRSKKVKLFRQGGIQRITVVGLVCDDAFRSFERQHEVEHPLHQATLVPIGRCSVDSYREAPGIH